LTITGLRIEKLRVLREYGNIFLTGFNVMNICRNTLFLFLSVVIFGASGCSNLTPTENGLLAAGAVGAATGVALGTTVSPSISIPVAIGSALLAGGGAYLYSKNRATIDQRRIAEARARLYYAQLNEAEQQRTNRYLAVNAPNTSKTQGQAVMLYDTQTKSVANDVYDMKKVPAVGQSTSIGNNAATYIGSGN
jgi:hypothetical protein